MSLVAGEEFKIRTVHMHTEVLLKWWSVCSRCVI